MGKQGPCYHCGVTSTPLWRNGPPDKPVLCNACGSRWRTKGTLTNYTPLHARTDHDDYEEHKVSKGKSITISRIKEVKVLKRKLNHETGVIGGFVSDSYQSFSKAMDEDTSNRSSSGSAISNSESCAQFGNDASDLTGPAQSTVWDTMVPSKKRTCVNRPKQSSVEKLTKELYTIWYEQQQQSSNFSGSSEEDLLFESERPMVSVEIGHGSVLIRHPSSIAREEESEASSLSVDNKMLSTNEAYSHSAMNKLHILANHNSPIRDADLKNVLNFDEFMSQLTPEEQKELMKYLPWIDSIKPPDSLKVMFESPQLNESLTSFQQLLAEGVFDSSLPGVKKEDCNSLRRLALFNLSKSQWVECYNQLKEPTSSSRGSDVSGANGLTLNSLMNGKRSYDSEIQNFPEAKKTTMKSPKRMMTKASFDNKDLSESDGSYYSPRSLFALPTDGSSSLMLESFHFVGETSDQGLLLDVKSNSSSFLQAELL